jgi:hypothetical protein
MPSVVQVRVGSFDDSLLTRFDRVWLRASPCAVAISSFEGREKNQPVREDDEDLSMNLHLACYESPYAFARTQAESGVLA